MSWYQVHMTEQETEPSDTERAETIKLIVRLLNTNLIEARSAGLKVEITDSHMLLAHLRCERMPNDIATYFRIYRPL